MDALTLYELNRLVRGALRAQLEPAYWVKGEVSEVRVKGGHCYLELVEQDERTHAIRAKARAVIWHDTYALLGPHFEQVAGRPLQPGMRLLVLAEPTFHELYGYSLVLADIDPTFTLGDLARRRQEILARLRDEGVIDMNHELQLPRLVQRIAVISSPTAAGYGDFCRQLEQSGLRFHVQLFPALMQGRQVEESFLSALDQIFAQADSWDVVAIIRGGGAVSDLDGFDTYLLAAAVAQFPLPILTGIGHERDDTVLDFVAHTRLKTPTAVAAFLIDRQRQEVEGISHLEERLRTAATRCLDQHRRQQERLLLNLRVAFGAYARKCQELLEQKRRRIERAAERRVAQSRMQLENIENLLPKQLKRRIDSERVRLERQESLLRLAGPERILRLGYSLTRLNGRIVTSAQAISPGDHLTTQFRDGMVESAVTLTQTKKRI